ncbi:hypothetical protein [Bdellovibrio sp. HCB337]|uniref:hypothetical protein n=1 Tax=Bdellovibrio sp. HCB337 TaxID=3394358 RepID=UPI0039A41720
MKSLLVFAMTLSGAFAQASDGISAFNLESIFSQSQTEVLNASETQDISASSDTRFNTILSWYKAGESVTFAEIKGFHAGRCFKRNAQNQPIGAMFGYYQEEASDDAGPGFVERNPAKINGLMIMNNALPADYFDNDDKFADNKSQFERLVSPLLKHLSNYVDYPTLSYTNDWETNGNPDERHEFKTYQNYIIEKWTAAFPQKYADMGRLNPGDVMYMCYYFKKLGE